MKVAFDMDGVLADFESAFREVEGRLFGSAGRNDGGQPVRQPEEEDAASGGEEVAPDAGAAAADRTASARELRERLAAVWRDIRATPNFWESLQPTAAGAVARIHEMMLRHRWQVFFITQRPATDGDTVQRQTQRWLVRHGFDLPSVLVIPGSRGAAARALQLDYHVDDTLQHCIDVNADSRAKPLLILPGHDESSIAAARALGIGTVGSIEECLDVLEKASVSPSFPGLLQRLAASVGWK